MLQNAASDMGLHCLPLIQILDSTIGSKTDLLKFYKNGKEIGEYLE